MNTQAWTATVAAAVAATIIAIGGASLYPPDLLQSGPGGLSPQPRSDDLDRAATNWNFTDINGTLGIHSTSTAWIDFAFPVSDGFGTGDLDVTVTFSWDNPGTQDDVQFRYCLYHGPKMDVLVDEYSKWFLCFQTTENDADGVLELTVESDGQGVSADVPFVLCEFETVCFGNGTELTLSVTVIDDYENWLLPDRPVLHLLFVASGRAPDTMSAQAVWQDTVVTWTSGGPGDTFSVLREDFDSGLWARVDTVPEMGPYYQRDAELDIDFENQGRNLTFWYEPHAYNSAEGSFHPSGYVTPDGREIVFPEHWPWFGPSEQSGSWRFWFDEALEHRPFRARPDAPVLYGTVFDWAMMPWESGPPSSQRNA